MITAYPSVSAKINNEESGLKAKNFISFLVSIGKVEETLLK